MDFEHAEHVAATPSQLYGVLAKPENLTHFVPQLTAIRPGRGVRVDVTNRLTSRPAAAPCFLVSSRLRLGSGLASAPQPMMASAIAPGTSFSISSHAYSRTT